MQLLQALALAPHTLLRTVCTVYHCAGWKKVSGSDRPKREARGAVVQRLLPALLQCCYSSRTGASRVRPNTTWIHATNVTVLCTLNLFHESRLLDTSQAKYAWTNQPLKCLAFVEQVSHWGCVCRVHAGNIASYHAYILKKLIVWWWNLQCNLSSAHAKDGHLQHANIQGRSKVCLVVELYFRKECVWWGCMSGWKKKYLSYYLVACMSGCNMSSLWGWHVGLPPSSCINPISQ